MTARVDVIYCPVDAVDAVARGQISASAFDMLLFVLALGGEPDPQTLLREAKRHSRRALVDGAGQLAGAGFLDASYADRLSKALGSPRKAINGKQRWRVFKRDGYACVYCGADEDLAVDHVVADARGGAHELSNFVTACRRCNSKKGARPASRMKGGRA